MYISPQHYGGGASSYLIHLWVGGTLVWPLLPASPPAEEARAAVSAFLQGEAGVQCWQQRPFLMNGTSEMEQNVVEEPPTAT